MDLMKKFIPLVVLPLMAGCSLFFVSGPELREIKGDRFIVELKYNTDDNFLKTNVYRKFGLDKCYLRPELAEKIQRLTGPLTEYKLKLVLFDCYRPLEVQREMWKILPDPEFVANPEKGSNHNRGVAIDVGLASEDGTPLSFPAPFDDFTKQASHSFVCPEAAVSGCENRDLLKKMMTEAGLKALNSEWWHYELPEAKKYPLLKRSLRRIP